MTVLKRFGVRLTHQIISGSGGQCPPKSESLWRTAALGCPGSVRSAHPAGPEARPTITLVPKLLLGNALVAQAVLGYFLMQKPDSITHEEYFAKRSFATKGVPKQELGNQKTFHGGGRGWLPYLGITPTSAPAGRDRRRAVAGPLTENKSPRLPPRPPG